MENRRLSHLVVKKEGSIDIMLDDGSRLVGLGRVKVRNQPEEVAQVVLTFAVESGFRVEYE